MCFYAYKNVLEPMGHLGANLIFSILTLNQVVSEHAARDAHLAVGGSRMAGRAGAHARDERQYVLKVRQRVLVGYIGYGFVFLHAPVPPPSPRCRYREVCRGVDRDKN